MADGYAGHNDICFATIAEAAYSRATATPAHLFQETSSTGEACVYRYELRANEDGDSYVLTWTRIPTGPSCQAEDWTYGGNANIASCDYVENPFVLDLNQGSQIAVAILSVWVVAWCWKALGRALQGGGEEKEI